MTAGIFYKVAVLHVGGTRNKGVRISLISTNGTKEDTIPENYLVAYRAGTYTPQPSSFCGKEIDANQSLLTRFYLA